MISQLKLWISGAIISLIGALGIIIAVLNSQKKKAITRADIAEDNAEEATELANTQSALSKAQQAEREKANEIKKEPIKRPSINTDFNKL